MRHSGRMASDEARAIELLKGTPYGRIASSRHAMPLITVARHIVVDRSVLLRVHRGHGCHSAFDGSVVAYEADNIGAAGGGRTDVWSVQFVGQARLVEPGAAELARFGPPAAPAGTEPFVPVYLRVEPRFTTVQRLA